jgi:hypothetical protein
MKLNHVNLTVDDVPAARLLLEKHFGMRPYGPGKKNFDVLFDDEDLVLTLIGVGRNNAGGWTAARRPGAAVLPLRLRAARPRRQPCRPPANPHRRSLERECGTRGQSRRRGFLPTPPCA